MNVPASALASALDEAMTNSKRDLVILDPKSGDWQRHPWQEVHTRAQNVAATVDGQARVGLVGEPTVEFLAGVIGTILAGAAVSILPGPIRGADTHTWAQSTVRRFADIGISTVLSHGSHLEQLRAAATGADVHDVSAVAHEQRSTTFAPSRTTEIGILQAPPGRPEYHAPQRFQPRPPWPTCAACSPGSVAPSPTSRTRGCRSTTTWV